jgi:hypothetical protein
MRYRLLIALIILLAMAGISSACSNTQSADSDAADKYFEIADPMADNLLLGINNGDYSAFSKDFDDAMKTGLNEAAFLQLKQTFDTKLGAYQFLQQDVAEKQDDYIVALYVVQFEKAPAVTMRMVITDDDQHKVTGLWFDSPELRQ